MSMARSSTQTKGSSRTYTTNHKEKDMNQTSQSTKVLAGKKRITLSAIGRYVFEKIHEDIGIEVGILSAEELTRWAPMRAGLGAYKVWRVTIADRGKVYEKFVTVDRNADGQIKAASIS